MRNPMVPPANLRQVLRQFDVQTDELLRTDLERAAGMIGELRNTNVKTFDHQPTTVAGATLLAAKLGAVASYTDRVLAQQVSNALRDGDFATAQALRPIVESRLAGATGDAATSLNHVLVDVDTAFASTPEATKSAEWQAWCDSAAADLRYLAGIAQSDDPVGKLRVYLDPALNALPALLPVSSVGGTVTIGAVPAGVE